MVDVLYEPLGIEIRHRREALGMTQDALASIIGLSRTSVTNIERGRQAIYVHQLISFGRALGVLPAELIANAADKSKISAPKLDSSEFVALLRKLTQEIR